jgi:hypothetical protein
MSSKILPKSPCNRFKQFEIWCANAYFQFESNEIKNVGIRVVTNFFYDWLKLKEAFQYPTNSTFPFPKSKKPSRIHVTSPNDLKFGV